MHAGPMSVLVEQESYFKATDAATLIEAITLVHIAEIASITSVGVVRKGIYPRV